MDRMSEITYLGVFEPADDGGFSVYFPDLPGCASYGDTLDEAQSNARDALALHLYGMEKDGDPIPTPSATPEINPETERGYVVSQITASPGLIRDEMNNRLVRAKANKKEAFEHFLSLFPEKGLDTDSEQIREERLTEGQPVE